MHLQCFVLVSYKIKTKTSIKNMKKLYLIMLLFISFIQIDQTNSAAVPLSDQRDYFMGSYQVGISYFMLIGPINQTVIGTHAPNIFPSSINYHVISALGYGADYYITTNKISISIEVSIIDLSSVLVSFYTDQSQCWFGFFWTWIMIIDVISPVYSLVLPSVLRLNPSPLPLSPIVTTVGVSTFNSSSLIFGNNIAIHSFIAGFVITSSNGDFQFEVSSLILDLNNIQIVLSYGTTITSIANVRIDTIVIDITQISFTIFPPLFPTIDIQFISFPTDSAIITFAQFTSDQANMIAGLSGFKSYGQPEFYLSLTVTVGSIIIGTSFNSDYFPLEYTLINFIYLGCSTSYPYFDSLNMLCHDTYCNPIGNYWQATPQVCQPCLYDCYTCSNGLSCSSCLSTNFRTFDPITLRCLPITQHFDDGTNNPVAPLCISPCKTCTGALICSTCINSQYYFDSFLLYCYLCSTSLSGCKTCTSSTYCTSCLSNSYYLDTTVHKCFPCSTFTVGCLTCSLVAGNLNCLSCNTALGFSLATNFLSCLCSITSYLDTIALKCFLCSNAMHRCYSCVTNAITCTQCQLHFYAQSTTNCAEICGDGFLFELQCDDGNLINGDGCDSTCNVQPNYLCNGGSSTTPSVCQININIQITIISYLKDQNQNKFYLDFSISPILSLTNLQLSSMLVPNFPTANIQINYNSITGICQYDIMYNQPLDTFSNMQVQFQLSSSKRFKIGLSRPTDNNLALKVYSSQMYRQIKELVKASEALCYLFLVVFVMGWFTGQQLLVTEMIFVLQYAYSGLFTSNGLDLSMKSFKQFAPLYGIVDINNLSSNYEFISSNTLPVRFSSLGFELSIIENINVSVILLLVIGFGSGLVYLIGLKLNLNTLTHQAKKISILWTFSWMMLMQFPLMTSIWIFCSNNSTDDKNFIIDILCSCCYGILYIGMGIYLLKAQNIFQEIKQKNQDKNENQSQDKSVQKKTEKFVLTKQWKDYFKAIEKEKEQSQIHSITDIDPKRYFYAVYMFYKLLISIVMVFLGDDSLFCQPITILFNLVMLIFVCVIRPYKNNISPILNSVMIVFLTVPYLYQMINSQSHEKNSDFFQLWGIVILIGLLYVVFLFNSFFILKEPLIKVYNFISKLSSQTSTIQANNQQFDVNKKTPEIQNERQFTLNKSNQKFIFKEQNLQIVDATTNPIQSFIQFQSNSKAHKRKKRQKQKEQQKNNIDSHHTTENILINVNSTKDQEIIKEQFDNNSKYGNFYQQNIYEKNNQLNVDESQQQFNENNNQKVDHEKYINQFDLDFQTILELQKVDKTKTNINQNSQEKPIIKEKVPKSHRQNSGISLLQQTITTIKQISSQSHIFEEDFLDFQQISLPKLQNQKVQMPNQQQQFKNEEKQSSSKKKIDNQKPKRIRRNKASQL